MTVEIEGMVCGNCAIRVENALNRMEGVWTKVDLSARQALIRSKQPIDEQTIRSEVRRLGYTVMKIYPWGKNTENVEPCPGDEVTLM